MDDGDAGEGNGGDGAQDHLCSRTFSPVICISWMEYEQRTCSTGFQPVPRTLETGDSINPRSPHSMNPPPVLAKSLNPFSTLVRCRKVNVRELRDGMSQR